jgi:phosphocarrier protein
LPENLQKRRKSAQTGEFNREKIDDLRSCLYNKSESEVKVSMTYRCKIGEQGMYMKDVPVLNQIGLHARPATFFIQKANEFKSSIWVEKEERRVNAKSLLGVLSLGIVGGTSIRIIADGTDEQTAVDALVKLVETGFSE